jgi:uncharacterized membrane protein YkvI
VQVTLGLALVAAVKLLRAAMHQIRVRRVQAGQAHSGLTAHTTQAVVAEAVITQLALVVQAVSAAEVPAAEVQVGHRGLRVQLTQAVAAAVAETTMVAQAVQESSSSVTLGHKEALAAL